MTIQCGDNGLIALCVEAVALPVFTVAGNDQLLGKEHAGDGFHLRGSGKHDRKLDHLFAFPRGQKLNASPIVNHAFSGFIQAGHGCGRGGEAGQYTGQIEYKHSV